MLKIYTARHDRYQQIRVAYTQNIEACLRYRQEEKGVDHSRSTWQAIESRGTQKKKVMDTREIPTSVPRSRLDSEEGDKGRQAGLHGRPGKSSRRGCQQG